MRASTISFSKRYASAMLPNGECEHEEIKICVFLDPGDRAQDALEHAENFVQLNIERRRAILPGSQKDKE